MHNRRVWALITQLPEKRHFKLGWNGRGRRRREKQTCWWRRSLVDQSRFLPNFSTHCDGKRLCTIHRWSDRSCIHERSYHKRHKRDEGQLQRRWDCSWNPLPVVRRPSEREKAVRCDLDGDAFYLRRRQIFRIEFFDKSLRRLERILEWRQQFFDKFHRNVPIEDRKVTGVVGTMISDGYQSVSHVHHLNKPNRSDSSLQIPTNRWKTRLLLTLTSLHWSKQSLSSIRF